MELLEQVRDGKRVPQEVSSPVVDGGERAARRALRGQIERLERELADAFVTAFSMGGLDQAPGSPVSRRACWTWESSSMSATSSSNA